MPADRWSSELNPTDPLSSLVYRSNLLGADRSLVNYGGGNTSTKTSGIDHRGRSVNVLWIKGSGSDLATIDKSGFTPVRLDDVRGLAHRDSLSDDDMVAYLSQCLLDIRAPRPSIETVLHGFLPFPNVDHTHPEAAIAFCSCLEGKRLANECFGSDIVWVPYVRPGFALAKIALQVLDESPHAVGMFLAKHGLVTWGQTGEESYKRTIQVLDQAESFLESRVSESQLFGGPAKPAVAESDRREVLSHLLPRIRGCLSRLESFAFRPVLHFDASVEVLQFVSSHGLETMACTGAACPDHVMYTKFLPLVAPTFQDGRAEYFGQAVEKAIEGYATTYQRWFEENSDPGVEMLHLGPRVILLPRLGMVTVGRDAWTARNTAALYKTAIRVMRWSSSAGTYTSLSAREAWEIEYWPLELYKLALRPPEKQLAGRIAVISGGAGAIGQAIAQRFLAEGGIVVLGDLNPERLSETENQLSNSHEDNVLGVVSDSSSEEETDSLFQAAVLTYGGVDIVVANAGIASAAPIDSTSLEEWERVNSVLMRGYFLTLRAAFRTMKRQGMGGTIVINASKNGLAPGKDAIPYASGKAAQLHMARCLAEEGGRFGIRVNSVAPDAVIQGSGLWNAEWRERRAQAYGFDVTEIEEFYRKRNALQVSVGADDVANAVLFLASDESAKTTGCVVTVDGGIRDAYPR